MRLLNSVCKRLAQKYKGIPVYIEDLPEGFSRPSFFVTLATEGTNLKNKNVFSTDNNVIKTVSEECFKIETESYNKVKVLSKTALTRINNKLNRGTK